MEDVFDSVQHLNIHIRIQQRNARKCLTTVQGLPQKGADLKALLKTMKKAFSTNGAIVDSGDLGSILQFQGDQRETIKAYLLANELAGEEDIKIHGA